jgi:hypothetical protein
MSEVWQTKLPTIEKMVLLIIADHANDEGTEAWPSQATMAKKASLSIRTIQRAVNSLVKTKFLFVEKHGGGSANCRDDRRPHKYTINIKILRGDQATTRILRGDADNLDGATFTPDTGRLSRPKNLPLEPSLETPFDLFWSAYPLKVGKQAALKAFDKALSSGIDPKVLISGANQYASDPNRHPSYTAHASTWLNAGRWSDDPLPTRELSIEEKKAKELESSRIKFEKEKEKNKLAQIEAEKTKQSAVPMPQHIKEMLIKTIGRPV